VIAEVDIDRTTGKIWARKFTVAHAMAGFATRASLAGHTSRSHGWSCTNIQPGPPNGGWPAPPRPPLGRGFFVKIPAISRLSTYPLEYSYARFARQQIKPWEAVR
jgi:hypothetical protein